MTKLKMGLRIIDKNSNRIISVIKKVTNGWDQKYLMESATEQKLRKYAQKYLN